jgi:hypothetical protein
MAGPDRQRLVLILSKRQDAKGNASYEFGTGYFVSPQLVLTASHVVPEDAVEVRMRVEKSGDSHYAETADGRVRPAWRDTRLDMVLLKVLPGISLTERVEWMEELPQSDLPWASTGYPDAATQVVDQHTQFTTSGMKGEIYSQGGGGQGQRELELTVENPADAESWRGISGAPVFVEDKSAGIMRIAGIIRQVPRDYKGGRLRALPSAVLLASASFRHALEPQWLTWPMDQPWMLVLKSSKGTKELEDRTAAALKTFNSRFLAVTGGQPFREQPVVAPILEALESPGRWLQLVRALCAAPVVLADVTDFEPGLMLALGVRAVVRRAITLTSTGKRYGANELLTLPFNIQEAKLTFHGGQFQAKDPDNPITVISQAMKDGLLESQLHPRYLDLPAFDAVRCPPDTTVGLQAARESVLVLCAFQKDYAQNWLAISDWLGTYYAPKPPVRMLDLSSPRLVGQALYEYIRWAGTCVVDWTLWRANVFFEMGVRLACSTAGGISIIDKEKADTGHDEQQKRLIKMFAPAEYQRDSPDASLKTHFDEHELRVSGKALASTLAVLPHDATYQAATEFFDWKQDNTAALPHQLLRASVKDTIGKDPQRAGVPPVLFSSNPAFAENFRTSMQERWIAAWYYLRERYPNEIKAATILRKEMKDVAENVLLWIPTDTKDKSLEKLLNEVLDFVDDYEKSPSGGTGGNSVG